MKPVVSLCIPTNGIIEWVMPVLDSIYCQNVPVEKYEVVVTDNGSNEQFEMEIRAYAEKYENLKYKKTNSVLFENQLDALRAGEGEYLKFINHRTVFLEGALSSLITFLERERKEKPAIYFANGAIEADEISVYGKFDDFVRNLGIYASWTTGVGIWKSDYNKIPKNQKYDCMSPHSAILFSDRRKEAYIIHNGVLVQELKTDPKKKGNYDLFQAFSVHEIAIAVDLYRDGDISLNTLLSIKKDYKYFIAKLYLDYCIRHLECSYELRGTDNFKLFFSKREIFFAALYLAVKSLIKKVVGFGERRTE